MSSSADFLPTERLARRVAAENKWLRLLEDRVRFRSGREAVHWKVDYAREGVGVIPLLENGRIILGLHWRYCTERWSWEIVAGGAEPGEEHAAAALRELEEETGHRAESCTFLQDYFPAPGLGNEHFHIYLATGLTPTGDAVDAEEIYTLKNVDHAEFERMVQEGAITDGFTLTAVYLAKARGLIWNAD
ncbi:MAG: ADP-ribose pyrophosphatase [Candidatus Sumerlaeota bacterium]|nr:ADP-ribose pyrophosphatase [Candidatus Sumerlaeota bacterium]